MNEDASDIGEVLAAAGLKDAFAKLSPSHQREYLKWIDEAKKPKTRLARIEKMCEMLKSK